MKTYCNSNIPFLTWDDTIKIFPSKGGKAIINFYDIKYERPVDHLTRRRFMANTFKNILLDSVANFGNFQFS